MSSITLKVNGASHTVDVEPSTSLLYILRNDLGLLCIVTFAECQPVRVEAIPLAIDNCRTRLALSIGCRRFRSAWLNHKSDS